MQCKKHDIFSTKESVYYEVRLSKDLAEFLLE